MYFTKEDILIDIEHQSIEIPNSGGIRQSTLSPAGTTLECAFEDTKTLLDVFNRGSKKSKNGPCLGWRELNSDYKWLSYEEVLEKSKNISFGLLNSGMEKGQDSHIVIYSKNRVEYVLLQLACFFQSAVFVPLYDTLDPSVGTFILNHVEAEFLACDTVSKAKSVLDVKDRIPKLRHIVVFEDIDNELRTLAAMKGVTLHQLTTIEESGKQKPQQVLVPCSTDLATICYTSGTTGNPKGVMLTHRNLVAATHSLLRHVAPDFISPSDVYLSYLPMAHVFDQMGQLPVYFNGGSVGFYSGDIKLLIEDISSLKPTIIIAVPRVLNKIYDKVQKNLQSNFLKRCLFNMALRAKEAELKRGTIRNNSLWDRLILKNIQNLLGGKLRLLAIGGAPMIEEVLSFYKHSVGCHVAELYGQTETTGAINVTVIGDYNTDAIGPPLSCISMKLKDVAEMGYYAANGEGEILVKGATVTKGYFKDPLKTAEIFDEEGWLRTGDIGRWKDNGALAVIDRKKNYMKLSQGEYISPEKVESVYMCSSYVDMIYVHGDSLENFLVAIVSPEKESLMSWCSEAGIKGSWNEICRKEVVKTHILKDMNEIGKKAGLRGFEQVKAIHLHPDGFSIQNDILTATMKVKRRVCQQQFKEVIQKMYRETKGKK